MVSKDRKLVLIQTHLEALPSYAMKTTHLPKTMCTSLDQINRNLYWKQSSKKNGIPMILWDKLANLRTKEA